MGIDSYLKTTLASIRDARTLDDLDRIEVSSKSALSTHAAGQANRAIQYALWVRAAELSDKIAKEIKEAISCAEPDAP